MKLIVNTNYDPFNFDRLTSHWINTPEEKEVIRQKFDKDKDKILPDLSPIPYDPNLNKNALAGISPKLKWFRDVEMTLLDYSLFDKETFVEDVVSLMEEKALFVDPIKKKPVIAFDLETTGLSTDYTIETKEVDGEICRVITPDNLIVGVVIATSENEGYYIPVFHSTLDNENANVEYEQCRQIISRLQYKFVNVAHNATYDLGILSANAIPINKNANWDTLLFYKFFRTDLRSHGLKGLSEKILARPQIEINEILGVKKGTYIAFQRLDSRNAMVYAIPDALNTYALYMELHNNSYYKELSPFQRLEDKAYCKIAELEARQIYNTLHIKESGIPLDKKNLMRNIFYSTQRTESIHKLFMEKYEVDINKDERTGIVFGSKIAEYLVASGIPEHSLATYFLEHFGMEIKTVTLKSGAVKTTYPMGSDIIATLSKVLATYGDETMTAIAQDLVEISNYRSLTKNLEDLLALWVNLREDDRGCFNPTSLRLNGTLTKRYSNSGLPRPRLQVSYTEKTKKMRIKFTDKQCSVNFQGFSKISSKLVNLEEIDLESLPLFERTKLEAYKEEINAIVASKIQRI